MTAPAGNFLGLNLGGLNAGAGNYVGLNLGVEWNDVPPEPPEPVIRGFRADAAMPWSRAPVMQQAVNSAWRQAAPLKRSNRITWSQSPLRQRGIDIAWDAPPRHRRGVDIAWRSGMPTLHRTTRLPWSHLPTCRRGTRMPWRGQLPVEQVSTTLPWLHPGLSRVTRRLPWLGSLASRRRTDAFPWLCPGMSRRTWKIPWSNAALIPWIVRPPETPEPPNPETPFPAGNFIGLNLGCQTIEVPGLVPFNLGVYACYAVRPRRRTYIVLNSVSVVRLPDRTPIEVDSIGLAGGADAWGWTIDMNLCDPGDLTLLKPTVSGPREIEISLNGYVWTGVVESYGGRREWNSTGVSISGRSRTALLSSPYAPQRAKVNTEERLMAQLVDEELADTGYTASYDTVDWVVPVGAWFYDGTSPLDAINTLAAASGAVVQSDPEDKSLRIRARYPDSPWEWPDLTPDVTIDDDIILSHALQVRSQPLYDAVVVTGEIPGKGVTARVKRTGEAGTLYAPQVSSQLINTIAAATERGRNVLSDRGEQSSIDLVLPLFATPLQEGETGRVLPLDLAEVHEADETWHGLCTNVRIDARLDGANGAWVIEQQVTLERHYSDAD